MARSGSWNTHGFEGMPGFDLGARGYVGEKLGCFEYLEIFFRVRAFGERALRAGTSFLAGNRCLFLPANGQPREPQLRGWGVGGSEKGRQPRVWDAASKRVHPTNPEGHPD